MKDYGKDIIRTFLLLIGAIALIIVFITYLYFVLTMDGVILEIGGNIGFIILILTLAVCMIWLFLFYKPKQEKQLQKT